MSFKIHCLTIEFTSMKYWISKGIYLLLLSTLIACDDNSSDNTTTLDDTLTTTNGWKVTYFWDKDKDDTSKFQGYTFFFETGGIFKAFKNGVTTTGTWKIGSNGNKLIINTGVSVKPLEELNDDWLIIEKSNTRIKLKDDNDTHDEFLNFESI